MERGSLITSKEYLMSKMQLGLLNLIGNYKDRKKLKDYELAKELGVSKGYVSQLLNATFDHKISKVVELALACNTVPLVYFVDINEYVKSDSEDKVYEIFPVVRSKEMTYEQEMPIKANKDFQKMYLGDIFQKNILPNKISDQHSAFNQG